MVSVDKNKEPKAGIGNCLEKRASELAAQKTNSWGSSVDSNLAREISLVLEQIENERGLRKEQLGCLLKSECYIWNELHGIERRTPKYSPEIFPEREKFLAKLHGLAKERRQLRREHQRRMGELHSHLLSLLNKHSHLNLGNGN